MVFNDTTDKLGICQEIDALCDTDTTSYPVADKVRRVNTALEEITGMIIGLDGYWQFDDSNFTSLPIGTTNLVEGQQDYSFDIRFLNIERVQVKDASGIWQLLKPIDKSQVNIALDEFYKDAGMPLYYDKNGESIFLYPKPTASQVTLTAGLKVFFQRTASLFTASDTTKEPGFASPFHVVLAYKAALPYCATYKKDRVSWIQSKIDEMQGNEEKGIVGLIPKFYAKREKDVRKVITMKPISFR